MSLLRRVPMLTWGAEPGPSDSTTNREGKFDLKNPMEQRGIAIQATGSGFERSPSPPVR